MSARSDFLSRRNQPALYRVHEGPTPEKLANLREFLKEFGLQLSGGDKRGRQRSDRQAAVALFAEQKVHRATQREQNERRAASTSWTSTSTIPDSDLRTRKQLAANVRHVRGGVARVGHLARHLVAESDSRQGAQREGEPARGVKGANASTRSPP